MRIYKVVPGPKEIKVKMGKVDDAFSSFAEIINKETKDGWEYHSMENLRVQEGCSLLGNTVNFYMLIFVKEE